MADGSSASSHAKPISPEALHPCSKKPKSEKGDTVKLKICTLPPEAELNYDIHIPTPCEIQIRNEKIKRGVIFCPKPPPEDPPPRPSVPECMAICIEKVKNIPIPISKHDPPIKCLHPRIETGFARCDRIRDAAAAPKDLSRPGCIPEPPPPPPPPPPKVLTPCEIQNKEQAEARCRAKYARYYPPKTH